MRIISIGLTCLAISCFFGNVLAVEPNRVLHVNIKAPNASDGNPGTKAAPWKTLEYAGKTAVAGDKVIIHPGVYKGTLGITNTGTKDKPIVFEGVELGKVILDGSEKVDIWRKTAENSRIWEAECKLKLSKYPPKHKYSKYYNSADPGDLAMDGIPLFFSHNKDLMPGSWTTNDKKNKIFLRLPNDGDPNKHEMTVINKWCGVNIQSLNKDKKTSLEHITVRNLHVRRYQIGMRIMGGGYNTLENNIVEWSEMWGILYNNAAHDSIIRNNIIRWSGHKAATGGHRIQFLNNKVLFSNWKLSSAGWDASSIKVTSGLDMVFEGNECAYSASIGIWFDNLRSGITVKNNILHDNALAGLEDEACFSNTFEGNVSYRNWFGFYLGNSSNDIVRNNIFADNYEGMHFRFNRSRICGLLNVKNPDKFSKKIKNHRQYFSEERVKKWLDDLLKYNYPCYFVRDNIIEKNIFLNNKVGVKNSMDKNIPDPNERYMIQDNRFIDNVFVNENPEKIFYGYTSLGDYVKKTVTGEVKGSIYMEKLNTVKLPDWAKSLYEKHKSRLEYFRPYVSIKPIHASLSVKNPNASLYHNSPTPAGFLALARICKSDLMEKITFSDKNLQAYYIKVKGRRTLVMWRKHGTPTDFLPVLLKGVPESARLETAWGQNLPIERKNGMASINVGTWPIYLFDYSKDVSEIQPFSFRIPKTVQETGEIKIAIRNSIGDGELYIDSLSTNVECPEKIFVKDKISELKVTVLPDDFGIVKIRVAGRLGEIYAGKTILFSTGKRGKGKREGIQTSGFKPINIKAVGNCSLENNSSNELLNMYELGASLDGIPDKLTVGKIKFNIDKKHCIGLASKKVKEKRPPMVSIPMNNKKYKALAFLQVVAYAPKKKGEELFHYRLNYGDNFDASVIVKNKINISDWWFEPSEGEKLLMKKNNAYLAWSGDCGTGHLVNVYVYVWRNPNPEKEILSLNIGGGDSEKRPALGILAISGLELEK